MTCATATGQFRIDLPPRGHTSKRCFAFASDLHALLVTGVCDDRRHIAIHDPLVVNRERYGCRAWVDAEAYRSRQGAKSKS